MDRARAPLARQRRPATAPTNINFRILASLLVDYSRLALGQTVAHSAHGDHELRVLRVALDLLAQVRDVDVAGADVAGELRLPELLHDLEPAEDLARVLGQQPQHLELGAGQVDRLAADQDEVAREVDPHVAGVDRLAARARSSSGRARGGAAGRARGRSARGPRTAWSRSRRRRPRARRPCPPRRPWRSAG